MIVYLRKKRKRFFTVSTDLLSFFLIICLLIPIMSVFSTASPAETSSGAESAESVTDGASIIYLYCPQSDIVLYSKGGDEIFHPYAVAKIMTLLVAADYIPDWDETFTVEEGMTEKFSNGYGISEGDCISYKDLAVLILFRGFDDAATVIARKTAGSDEKFVELMNEKAESLGTSSTEFKNPTGRGDKGSTTAGDSALIAAEFCKNDILMNIAGSGVVSCRSLGQKKIYNRNFYFSGYYNATGKSYISERADGIIAGSVLDPEMLISSATIENYTYITIVMDAKKADGFSYPYEITNKLLGKYAGTFGYVSVLTKSDPICEIPVNMGDGHDSVVLSPDRDFYFYVMNDSDVKKEFSYEYTLAYESLDAPVESGTAVGQIILYRNGEEVGRADLVTRANISKSMSAYYYDRTRKIITDKFVIRLIVVIAAVFVITVMAIAIIRGQMHKYKEKNKNR